MSSNPFAKRTKSTLKETVTNLKKNSAGRAVVTLGIDGEVGRLVME